MIIIGLLHTRLDPCLVSRAYLYSALARAENAKLYYFTSRDIDFSIKTIKGKYYRRGAWIMKESRFPDVVINVSGPNTPKQRAIYNRLKSMVPFTSHKVGNKMMVYNRLVKAKAFAQYVIPYRPVKSVDDILAFLEKHQKVIVKPNAESHGNYIYYIEKTGDEYRFIYRNREFQKEEDAAKDYMTIIIKDRPMLMQKYINSRRKTGEAYDFRLHVQKDGYGIWQITAILPRVAHDARIITNLSQGAFLSIFDCFIESEFPERYRSMKFKIEGFALLLARHMETIYNCEFDELGIDIGIDESGKIWIYEVNWRPGHVYIEAKAARNAINYAIYLAKKKMRED
ncbi:MAG: YheC/YheD family protein [Bacilli bacterium]|nr:YheC/YheD family protein [Bacilli bacterium]